ncbi:MAG: hypothetical protein KGK08_14150, partial [Acidobacteriota bacterium]|nr:hypothetical protein [Acidobacteriota bacterium]
FASYQRNVSRLEAALDDTFASGLINEFVTTRKDAPLLYGAFIQDLVSTETLPLTELDLKKWTKQHFYMGLIRTADSLIRQPRWYVSREVKDLLRKYITDDLINEAWNYLGKKREA